MLGLIEGIKKLIHMDSLIIDLEYPLNQEAAEQLLNDQSLFKEKVKKWTIKYAKIILT